METRVFMTIELPLMSIQELTVCRHGLVMWVPAFATAPCSIVLLYVSYATIYAYNVRAQYTVEYAVFPHISI